MTAYQPLDVRMAEVVMPGESVRWTGSAPEGLRFHAQDAYLIPFSLLWGGFAIFWETLAVVGGTPWFFWLWGIPFVVLGVYFIVGRFFVDAYLRSQTHYAVTDRAAYVARFGTWPAVRRYAGSTLDAIQFELQDNGAGTIRFIAAPTPKYYGYGARLSDWNWATLDAFDDVPDARSVYALILKARSAKGSPS